MNWAILRFFPWLDTRARFVSRIPEHGTLLDLGSSDGETLSHMAELRPDLKLLAADIAGRPENYPAGCEFRRVDFDREALPWPNASVDGITCMHLVEHLQDLQRLMREIGRVLKPGARAYFETPHPKTLNLPRAPNWTGGRFTLNFFDDPTHVRVITMDVLGQLASQSGLRVQSTGISRNWLFAASHLVYQFLPPSRKKFTARVHWLGWSAYLIAQRSS